MCDLIIGRMFANLCT